MIVEVIIAILAGGGVIGTLAGRLLIRWLDGRSTRRRPRRVIGVAENAAQAGESVRVRIGPPVLPPAAPRWPETRPSHGPPAGREGQPLPLDPEDE